MTAASRWARPDVLNKPNSRVAVRQFRQDRLLHTHDYSTHMTATYTWLQQEQVDHKTLARLEQIREWPCASFEYRYCTENFADESKACGERADFCKEGGGGGGEFWTRRAGHGLEGYHIWLQHTATQMTATLCKTHACSRHACNTRTQGISQTNFE